MTAGEAIEKIEFSKAFRTAFFIECSQAYPEVCSVDMLRETATFEPNELDVHCRDIFNRHLQTLTPVERAVYGLEDDFSVDFPPKL